MNDPSRVVLMSAGRSAQSAIGVALAERLHARFIEGDAFHAGENIEQAVRDSRLTDEDRWAWLAALRQAMVASNGWSSVARH